MGQSMILSFFGGVSQDRLGLGGWGVDFDKVLADLAKWLLPIAICLLAEGVCVEKRGKIEPLSCYRYETVRIWWRRKFAGSLLCGLAVAAALFLGAAAVDMMDGAAFSDEIWGNKIFSYELWKVFLLWLAHIVTILSFFSVLDLTGMKRFAPTILLLLEGFTFLLGFLSASAGTARFMYGMWGMYFQSGWHMGEAGIPVPFSLAVEGLTLAFAYLGGQIVLRRAVKNRRG